MLTSMQTSFFQELHLYLEQQSEQLFWWEIRSVFRESFQRLYQSDEELILCPHQIRQVDEVSYALEVLVPVDQEGMIGQASLDVDCDAPLDEQLALAIQMAQNNPNKMWDPVQPPQEDYARVKTADDAILQDPQAVVLDIEREAKQTMVGLEGVAVTTAELYVCKSCVQRFSSTGVQMRKDLSDIYFEVAMEKTPDHQNQEVNNVLTSMSHDDLKVSEFIRKTAEETLILGQTQEPTTSESAVVLVNEDAISSFMAALRSQLNCANEYYKFPCLQEGDRLESEGDALHLRLDPFLPAMVDSSPYTGDGLIAQAADVIVEGQIQTQIVGNRFGQYLGKQANGILGNMVLSSGEYSVDDLRYKVPNVIEVIKFSSLLVDDNKLTWSSEIKLAKQYNEDGSVTLFKGGVVSGQVRENLKHCYFSKELGTVNFPGTGFYEGKGYYGPSKMLIMNGVSIVGA